MNINKEWHLAHKMPLNPTLEQRIAWQTEHLKNCQSRSDLPEKLRKEMEKHSLL